MGCTLGRPGNQSCRRLHALRDHRTNGGGKQANDDNGRDAPGDEAMRRVAEEDFIGVDADPLGPQSARDVAAETRCHPLRYHQPDHGRNRDSRCRGPFARPGRYGGEAEAGAQKGHDERHRDRRSRAGENRAPRHGGLRRLRCGSRRFYFDDGHHFTLSEEEGEKNDDRNRNTEQPEQDTASHNSLLVELSAAQRAGDCLVPAVLEL